MNQIFKTKLVALVAILCGNSLCQSHAMQADSEFLGYAPSSALHASESGQPKSAFGSVRAAPIGSQNQAKLPPIVSADSASSRSGQPWQAGNFVPEPVPMAIPKISAKVPPIVSADSVRETTAKITSRPAPPIVSGDQMRNGSSTTIAKKAKPKKRVSNMLAPMLDESPESDKSLVKATPAPAPSLMDASMLGTGPAVVQATTSVPGAMSGKVQQAAQWGPRGINAGYSSAGIPIYPQDGPVPGAIQAMPSVVEAPSMPMSQGLPPIISSDSQMVSPLDPMIGPGAIPIAPAPTMQSPMMSSQPSYMTGESYIQPPMMEAPVIANSGCSSCSGGGCNSCSDTGSVSNCQSCGNGGCFNDTVVENQFGSSGSVYSARRYLVVDALYYDRNDGSVGASNFGQLGDFDSNVGGRITLGVRADATRGNELSYMGVPSLEQDRNRTDPLGRLNTNVISGDGFTGVESTAFRNGGTTSPFRVFEQNESKETALHSLEFNKVKWGWDVVKTYVGFRYIHIQDQYELFSRGNDGVTEQSGTFRLDALNNMLGGHAGSEWFYDIGYRLSFSLTGKAGAYVNFNRLDTDLINNGTQFLDASDESVTIAGSLEAGLTAHYQLSQRARFRFGYEVFWLGNVASVSDNFPSILSPLTGADSGDSDDMFFHGLSLGFEVYR